MPGAGTMTGGDGKPVQTGASVTVTIDCGGLEHTNGKTLYVIPDGPEFGAIAIEGLLPGSTWVAAAGQGLHATTGAHLALVISAAAPGAYVVGADYAALRVVGTGGTDPVEADLEAEPPVEAVIGSSLEAGIMIPFSSRG